MGMLPTVVDALVTGILLFFLNALLYRQYKQWPLLFWTGSWGFFSALVLFNLGSEVVPWSGWQNLAQLSVLMAGLLLLKGISEYTRTPQHLPLGWKLFAGAVGLSILLALFFPLSPSIPTFLSFLFLGCSNLSMGWYFLKNKSIPRLERSFLGIVLIFWGLHKLDYPFLRPHPQLAVWGYTLGSILGMATGIGLLLVFLSAEQRKARESESRLRSLVDSLDDVFFTLDREGRHTDVFGRWVSTIPGGASRFIGHTAEEILGPEDGKIHLEMARKAWQENQSITYEWDVSLPKGKQFYQTTLSPVRDEKGNCVEMMGIGRDITPLHQALEQVKDRLKEKNIFLHEIQHRVQNNLQVIISLLNLQARTLSTPEARKAFQVAISRIQTYSDIYNQLEGSENLTTIRLDSFLQTLLERMIKPCVAARRLTWKLEVEEITLPLESALSVGLILNEFLHGFLEYLGKLFQKNHAALACPIGTLFLRRKGDDLEFILEPRVEYLTHFHEGTIYRNSSWQELGQFLVTHIGGTIEFSDRALTVRVPVF